MYRGMPKSRYSRRIEVRVPSRDFEPGVQMALERVGRSASNHALLCDIQVLVAVVDQDEARIVDRAHVLGG